MSTTDVEYTLTGSGVIEGLVTGKYEEQNQTPEHK